MVTSALDREVVARAAGVVVASTLALTASFVGVVAFLAGETAGVAGRLPFYVLAMAAAFAGTVFALDDPDADGNRVITATAGVAVVTFLVVTLGVEGLFFAVRHPGRVLASNLVVYFAAAGLICTGLAFWALRHWREFAERDPDADADA